MSWFEDLTGFHESSYEGTRARFKVQKNRLISLENSKSFSIGKFELIALKELREKAKIANNLSGKLKTSLAIGDVRSMHRAPENNGALFQVASQFNMLEMKHPTITPEHGVTRYQNDPTQGPACAIATGAATIYRNYFVPLDGKRGQTSERQLDGLADLGSALSKSTGLDVNDLWKMENGYALASQTGLDAISEHLESLVEDDKDFLREKLRVGLHSDVEVTDKTGSNAPIVSQIFCSALPVAYTGIPSIHWEAFASLVLEAAYEATMWAAVMNAQRGASNVVFLTLLGGGAFGNPEVWIFSAIRRALNLFTHFNIDVRLVSFQTPSNSIQTLVEEFN